jgi:hypothetical protein
VSQAAPDLALGRPPELVAVREEVTAANRKLEDPDREHAADGRELAQTVENDANQIEPRPCATVRSKGESAVALVPWTGRLSSSHPERAQQPL